MAQRPHFHFEDLHIWQEAKALAIGFHSAAEKLEEMRLYRYAEQLRSAGLSISNNIAEGSASMHPAEFKQFLNIARRSLFEDASMLLVFEELRLISTEDATRLLEEWDTLSRQVTSFSRDLRPRCNAKGTRQYSAGESPDS